MFNSDLLSRAVRSGAGGVSVRHFIGLGEGVRYLFIALFNFNFIIVLYKFYKSIIITFCVIIGRTRNESENREMSYKKIVVNKKMVVTQTSPSFLFFL